MAKTDDVLDINPLERMDKLNDIRREKKQTLASKKKELEELELKKRLEMEELEKRKKKNLEEVESKKRELENLEKTKAKEIEETENLIDQSFQDLMRHKRMIIKEDEDKYKKNLEQMAANAPGLISKNIEYGKFFEKLEVPDKLYDITNKGFYQNLTSLKEKALSGDLTPQEESFIEQLKEKFESFNQPGYLQNRDNNNYVQRSLNVIKEIDVSIYYR